MDGLNDNHPCKGKDCLQCETCIFDRDLFEDGMTPNEREKENNNNKINMCNTKLCNECPNLIRDSEHTFQGKFDAACSKVSYSAFGKSRPRRIDYNLAPNQSIAIPSWCPLKECNTLKLLPPPQESRPRPQDTGPHPSETTSIAPAYTSYSDRREKMKNLKRHLEWDDIKEGNIYVIPKILNQARKIVKVITKTSLSCTCHEISDITGNEFTYNCTVYPSDIDAVFITELRKF